MQRRLHAIVTGRVQGVYYRNYVCRNAQQLQVMGWVRNLDDGSVEVAAEGEDADLRQLEMCLKQGPPLSRVDEVEVTYGISTGEMSDFTIS